MFGQQSVFQKAKPHPVPPVFLRNVTSDVT
jgi:hypothetical protein